MVGAAPSPSQALNDQQCTEVVDIGEAGPGHQQVAEWREEAGAVVGVQQGLRVEPQRAGPPQAGVPGAVGYGTIEQGFLETSNVNSVDEITALITAQRAYEMNSKVVSAADQMLQDTSRLGGS